MPAHAGATTWPILVVATATRVCGLPVSSGQEVMRALPVAPLGGMPGFVRGVAIIRGEATPVIDLAALFGDLDEAPPRWFVALSGDGGRAALAVAAVQGVRVMPPAAFEAMPGLLGSAAPHVQAVGVRDARLFWLLNAARLLPASEPEASRADVIPGRPA